MAVYNSKDKLAYFKDNKQSQEAQEEFDMTKYYYNRDGMASSEQQQAMSQHVHSDSRGFNTYIPGGPSYSAMHTHPSNISHPAHQQRVPMPQLTGRSQSGSSPGMQMGDAHYLNVPQMQRSVTSPYGAPSPTMNMYHQMPNRMTDMNPVNGPSQQMSLGYGMPRPPDGSGGIQYDSTNFPVLTGQPQQLRYPTASGPSPTLPQHSGNINLQHEEFTLHNDEDFPALPGSQKSNGFGFRDSNDDGLGQDQFYGQGSGVGVGGGRPQPNSQYPPVGGGSQQHHSHPSSPGLYPSSNPPQFGPSPNGTPSRSAPPFVKVSSPKLPSSNASEGIPNRPETKYGLLGLLDVIRLTDRDLNILALGSDLTTYGLNLNSSDCLYASFASPFSDHSVSSEPLFATPSCYQMPPPSLKAEHLSKFLVETLFYMFYALPRDVLQVTAAQELHRRDWRYHAEMKLWLKPRTPQEQMQSHPSVQYVYFDPNVWEARLFTTNTRNPLATGFLTEDDLRGKTLNGLSSGQSPASSLSASVSGISS